MQDIHSIAPTKLSPEAQSSYTVPRLALYRRLNAGLSRRATVVTAAAGYGKSTLLTSYLTGIGCPVIWYRLHEDDADPLRFLLHLAEGCRRVLPALPLFDARLTTSSQLRRNPLVVLAPLMSQLAELNQDRMALVLDDFHAISHAVSIVRILDYLLKYLPPSLHVFISSRNDITTPELARLRQYGEVLDLSEEDLTFSIEETASLLEKWGVLDVPHADVQRIVERTSGWVAALQMICQQLSRRVDSVDNLLSVKVNGSRQPTYDYLALHVLSTQPAEIQGFMERTSYLFQITPAAVGGILGTENAGEMLEHLCRGHALISYLGKQAGQPVYQYHSLFRDFLQSRLFQRDGASAVREFHLACGQFFESGESWEAAFHHFCRGEHWDAACRIVRHRAMWLIRGGELTRFWDWLGRIPPGVLENDPWLLLYRGRTLRLEQKLPSALATLQRAEWLFRPRKDRAGIARALLEKAWISWDLGELPEGLRLFEEALHVTPGSDHYLRAEINSYLIHAYATCGRFRDADNCSVKAMALLERVRERRSSLVLRARTLRRRAWAQLQQGRIGAARLLAEQACDLCETESLDERTTAHCLRILALERFAIGDLVKAMGLLDRAGEIAERRGLVDLWNKVTGARGDILAISHDLSQAENLYTSSNNGTSLIGGLAYVWLYQRRLAEARQACLREIQDAEARRSLVELARARGLLGVVERELGDLTAAERQLSQAESELAQLGAQYFLAGVRLHLARVLYERGQPRRASEMLTDALRYAQREQCLNSFLWLPDMVAYVAAHALRENPEQELVLRLCLERLSAMQLGFFLPLLSVDDPKVRDIATRITLELAPAAGGDRTAVAAVLSTCRDDDVRAHILNAVVDQRLTMAGIVRLRHTYGLTWREVQIFVHYYLPDHRPDTSAEDPAESHRARLAQSMCITDNTLRYHISAIRRKLGLLGGRRGISVYQWALDERIISNPESPALRS